MAGWPGYINQIAILSNIGKNFPALCDKTLGSVRKRHYLGDGVGKGLCTQIDTACLSFAFYLTNPNFTKISGFEAGNFFLKIKNKLQKGDEFTVAEKCGQSNFST